MLGVGSKDPEFRQTRRANSLYTSIHFHDDLAACGGLLRCGGRLGHSDVAVAGRGGGGELRERLWSGTLPEVFGARGPGPVDASDQPPGQAGLSDHVLAQVWQQPHSEHHALDL